MKTRLVWYCSMLKDGLHEIVVTTPAEALRVMQAEGNFQPDVVEELDNYIVVIYTTERPTYYTEFSSTTDRHKAYKMPLVVATRVAEEYKLAKAQVERA